MTYLLLAIGAMTLATQFTRWFPFLLFSRREPPQKMIESARLIPGAVMVVLVMTSLPMDFQNFLSVNWISWASVLLVAVLHLLFRHPLLSIFGGTAVYMVLLNYFG